MSMRWPYRRFLGIRHLGFSLPPFSFVFTKQITDNCFRFYQYIIYLSKGYIKYFAQINTLVKMTIFTQVKQSQILISLQVQCIKAYQLLSVNK